MPDIPGNTHIFRDFGGVYGHCTRCGMETLPGICPATAETRSVLSPGATITLARIPE